MYGIVEPCTYQYAKVEVIHYGFRGRSYRNNSILILSSFPITVMLLMCFGLYTLFGTHDKLHFDTVAK